MFISFFRTFLLLSLRPINRLDLTIADSLAFVITWKTTWRCALMWRSLDKTSIGPTSKTSFKRGWQTSMTITVMYPMSTSDKKVWILRPKNRSSILLNAPKNYYIFVWQKRLKIWTQQPKITWKVKTPATNCTAPVWNRSDISRSTIATSWKHLLNKGKTRKSLDVKATVWLSITQTQISD